MNSVVKHLTPETIAATLIAMRSGRKEIFLLVEGGKDITLYSQVLQLPVSNFVDCRGKENMMAVFNMAPRAGLDSGTIFLRDRDNDGLAHAVAHDVALFVTDRYDIEMHLLEGRLFGRVMTEYLHAKAKPGIISDAFETTLTAAGLVGSLRLFASLNGLALDFNELKFDFVEPKTMTIDVKKMIRKVSARSKLDLGDVDELEKTLIQLLADRGALEVVSGKDALEIMHIALARHFQACPSSQCAAGLLARVLRIAAILDDLRPAAFFIEFRNYVAGVANFSWGGAQL